MSNTKIAQRAIEANPASVAEMVADTRWQVGDVIMTQGYDFAGDGCAAVYRVVASGTADNILDHDLDNGLVAQLAIDGPLVRGEWAGCRDDKECSAELVAAFDRAASLTGTAISLGHRVTFTLDANILVKDTVQLSSLNMDVNMPGGLKAVTGGNLEASTAECPVPIMKLRTRHGQTRLGTIDCNRICAGVLDIGSNNMEVWPTNITHFPHGYGWFAPARAGRGVQMYSPNIKQWQLDDPEHLDDAAYTAPCVIIGHMDWQMYAGTLGWSKPVLLCLAETPSDPDERINGRNIMYKGTAAEEFVENASDFHAVHVHLMAGRPYGGPPRLDEVISKGGSVLIENWSDGRGPIFDDPDMDAGIVESHGNITFRTIPPTPGFATSGGLLTDGTAYQVYPNIRLYANGWADSAKNVEIDVSGGWTVGFYDFEGETWNGDVNTANIGARANTPGYDGAIRMREFWNPASGSFPAGSGRLAGDQWVVSADGTVGGHAFTEGNLLTALVNSPSTSVYAANWVEADYYDVPNRRKSTATNLGQGVVTIFTPVDTNRIAQIWQGFDTTLALQLMIPGNEVLMELGETTFTIYPQGTGGMRVLGKGISLEALAAEPTGMPNGSLSRSDGTASTNGFGVGGAGIYEKVAGAWAKIS